jgi:ABC-type glycerol-3-phosphate transport system permease component
MPPRPTKSFADHLRRIATYFVLGVGALLIVFPLAWAFSSSLKPNLDVFRIPMEWIPREIHPENYVLPFKDHAFGTYFLNSLFAAGSVMVLSMVMSSLAGFSLAKYTYFGRDAAFLAILSTLMLPVQVILVPLYLVVRDLGWLDSYQGLIIPQAVTAFGIFLMRQHIVTIPDDYLDAARMDGASELGILWWVIVPMSKPALAAVAIFSFLGNWDSLLWPLVVVSKESLRTLPLGISLFFSEYASTYNQALAVSLVVMLPVLVIFVVMQKQFIEGLARSGLRS